MRMNNKQKMFDNKQRFSFRKLTVGLASVLLGLTFMTSANTNQVQAAEQSGTTQSAGTQTTGDSDALEKPSQPVNKDDDLHISDSHVTQDQAVSSLSDGHSTQDLNSGKDAANDGEIKPVDSNSAVSNTGEQLTYKETPVNKNSLSTTNNSESKVATNAAPATVATGSNTNNPADQANEVQPSNSAKVKIRSRRAVTSALTTQDVINWDAVQYRKQADGNVDITGWDVDKGGIDILLPNTWDFTQKGIISDGKKAEITAYVMRDIAEASNTKAKAENKTYNVKISENGDGKLIAKDQDWSYIFSNKTSIDNRDIDRATKLESANLNNLDTSNVTDMSHMFDGANRLQSLDVSEWDTHNVTDMLGMFSYANSLQSLDISKWDTGSVTDMRGMFSDASRLQSLDVSKWDTHNVTNMWYMFSGASSLQSLDVSKWDTSNVTDVSSMFSGANSLQSLDVSKWDTSKVTNMSSMFADAKTLQSLDVSKWDTSNVTDMSSMFSGAKSLQSLDVSKWDTHNVTNMLSMFAGASSLQSLDVSGWNTSNVTNMSFMFYRTSNLQSLDVSKWNTGNVTDMHSMFANASMRSVSANASRLQSLDVSRWDTHNVTDMSNMFYGTSSLQSLDVSNWNTSKVTNMDHMFDRTSSLQSLDLSNWNTHNVTSMNYMFRGANSLQSLDVSNWDTSNVTNMHYMFMGAGSANGLVITANNYQGTPVPGASDTRKLAIISNVKDHFTDVNTWGNRPKTLTIMVHDETTHTDHEETVELDTIAYDSPEALHNAIQEKLTAFKNSKTDATHIASDPILTSNPANLAQELNATYKMNIELSQIHIDPDHPVNPGEHINGTIDKTYPTGLTHDDLNKTVTREVTITDPTGKKSTTTQTVTFTRGATVDTITNKVTYDAWSENGKHTFDKVDVPIVTGYTASGEVPEIVVTPDTPSSTVNITYTPKEYTVHISYICIGEGKLAEPEILTGHYGESINIPIKTFTGYHVYPEADYTKYKFGIDSLTGQELNWSGWNGKDLVDPADPSDPYYKFSSPREIVVQYVKDSVNSGYNIAYVDTYGAVINRPDHLQGISGEATNYTAPVINGYTLTNPQDVPINFGDSTKDVFLVYKPQDVKVTYHYVDERGKELAPSVVENNHFTGLTKVDENTKQINGYSLVSTPKQRVVEDLKDLDLSFVYTANDAHQHIHYVDENGNDLVDPKDASGNDVNDGTVTGVTDETVNVPVPDGWDLVDNSDSTTTLTNPDTNGEVATKIVKITHGIIVVDHTDPHDTGAPVDPNKPNGPKYDGVTDQDLNQDAIRRFVFYLPANTKAEDYAHTFTQTAQTKVTWDSTANTVTVTQTVGFYRDAIVDKITGKVVGYKAKDGTTIKLGTAHDHGWIPADQSNGRFEAIIFKQIKGYTPNVRATGPKKSVNMMVKPALFRTAMFYNVSFFANATFEKPEEKEIPKKAGNQNVIPSNKTTGKDTEPAKYVPKDPIQNGKSDPVKPTDGEGASSNLPQTPKAKPDRKPDTMLDDTNKSKGDSTNPVTPSGSNDSTPSTLVDNTSKSDDTQKQESEVTTNKQKPIDSTETAPAEKIVKKHAKKSSKKGVKKTAKATKSAPSVATVAATPVSNAKVNEVVSTTATVRAPETKSDEKTLPQTGDEDNASLIALGVIMVAFPSFVGLLVPKKKRDEN